MIYDENYTSILTCSREWRFSAKQSSISFYFERNLCPAVIYFSIPTMSKQTCDTWYEEKHHPIVKFQLYTIISNSLAVSFSYILREFALMFSRLRTHVAAGLPRQRFVFKAVTLWEDVLDLADKNKHPHPQPLLYWFSVWNLSLTHCHGTCLGLQ